MITTTAKGESRKGEVSELTVIVGVGQEPPGGSVGTAVVEDVVARAVRCAVPARRVPSTHLCKHMGSHDELYVCTSGRN